jgi:hypothetical protein
MVVSERVLRALPERLKLAQAGFAETGGMHAVGLFDAAGALMEKPRRCRAAQTRSTSWSALRCAMARCPGRTAIVLLSGRAELRIASEGDDGWQPGGGRDWRAFDAGGGNWPKRRASRSSHFCGRGLQCVIRMRIASFRLSRAS